ncbi:protein tyrosine/serine phosphatase [Caballeronia temeraria]|uniref:Protein tyrosine/serine phosphatase n=1 Tax=Caballeronia temeraria TaxID=1777137 RepID=A0A158B8B5_9BURK|nr:dual specificity protein phosphatase family protein [Caballeronia temeraria]SAK66269.1 protein tyrosine/serine phosphatase [Caballeronia temeraria]
MNKLFRVLFYGAGLLVVAHVVQSKVTTAPVAATDATTPASMTAARPLNWAEPIVNAGVDNLHRITPSLYRSAQITATDIPKLRALGIRKIISFRSFHSDEELLKDSGIALERIRINTWSIRDEDMIAALKALRDVDRDGPVLIHCQHGADRTGLVSALYRVVYQGWTKQQAEDELLHGGYGFHPVWTNIKSYLDHVDVEWLKRQLIAVPRAV